MAWYNTKDYPQVKERIANDKEYFEAKIKEITDNAYTEKVYINTRLYNLEKWAQRKQIIDSLTSRH